METGIFPRSQSVKGGDFVCFLEGKSEKAMLDVLIPRLIGVTPRCHSFSGKSDLKAEIEMRLAYDDNPNNVFLVMCDKDRDDCAKLKNELLGIVGNKIKRTKIRIACRELESFYLGDLRAVGNTLKLPDLYKKQDEFCYGMPDNCKGKPSELLKELTEHRYRKTTSPEGIAKELDLDGNNKSHSFNMLISAIKDLHDILQQNANS